MNADREILIYERLQKAFSPVFLEVIDDSDAHINHAGYQGGNRHFTIKIQASCLSNIKRIDAHRAIYAVLDDMIPDQIHALKINILMMT